MIKKMFGFTLAEILVAITILGVVASLTIPKIVLGQQSTRARAEYDTAYSIISKSVAAMYADGVSTSGIDYSGSGFTDEFKKYTKYTHSCTAGESDSVCYATSRYKQYNNNESLDITNNGQFVVNNGMLFIVTQQGRHLWVTADINGVSTKPNRNGWDVFTFYIKKDGEVMPAGISDDAPTLEATGSYAADARKDSQYFEKLYNGR